MKSHSYRFGVCAVLALLAAGCGTAPLEEDIGEIQQGLSFGTWETVTGTVAAQHGVAFTSHRTDRLWALAVPYTNKISMNTWQPSTWEGWTGASPDPNVLTRPAAASWFSSATGSAGNRNNVAAYVGSDGKIRLASYMYNAGGWSTWSAMTDTNIAFATPALAYANGWLYLFVKKIDNKVYWKRNDVTDTSYSFSNWSANWTQMDNQLIDGGLAAAGFSSTGIVVVGAKRDGSNVPQCAFNTITASTGVDGTWANISPGCGIADFSTPALANTSLTDNGPAQLVINKNSDFKLKTTNFDGTWDPFTNVPSTGGAGCGTTSSPTISYVGFDGVSTSPFMAIGAMCQGDLYFSWIKAYIP